MGHVAFAPIVSSIRNSSWNDPRWLSRLSMFPLMKDVFCSLILTPTPMPARKSIADKTAAARSVDLSKRFCVSAPSGFLPDSLSKRFCVPAPSGFFLTLPPLRRFYEFVHKRDRPEYHHHERKDEHI